MPVKKFRSVEEMERDDRRYKPGSPELIRHMVAIWDISRRLAPTEYPPGVFKHRSIEAMNEQTNVWRRQSVRRRQSRNTV